MENIKGNISTFWLSVAKGTIVSLCFVMVSILLFAFVVKWASLGEGAISIVNQVLKIVAIFFGVFVAMKKTNEKYLLKGVLVGFLFSLLSFVLFSTLNGSFDLGLSFFVDLIFASIIGALCAIILKFLL